MAFPVESTLVVIGVVYGLLRGEVWLRHRMAEKKHAAYVKETNHIFYPKTRKHKHTVVGARDWKPCGVCKTSVTSYSEFEDGSVECLSCGSKHNG